MIRPQYKKHILIITHGPFPPDIRIEKEVSSLVEDDFIVDVMANNISTKEKKHIFGGARVNYINIYNVASIPILNLFLLIKYVKQISPDVIQLCDAPLTMYIFIISKIFSIDIIYDNHEIWSLLARYTATGTFKKKLGYLLYFFLELVIISSSKKIIVVNSEAKRTICNLYKCNKNKVFVVRNVCSLTEMEEIPLNPIRIDSKFVLSFVGSITNERIDEIITAMYAISSLKLLDILFIIVGDSPFPTHLKMLHVLRAQLNLKNRVLLTGRLSFDKAMNIIAASNACFLGFSANPFTHNALPHKLTQYLFFKKPVICCNLRLITKLVKGALVIYKCGDSRSLASVLQELYFDGQKVEKLGILGKRLVVESLNWEIEKKRFLDVYHNLS